MESEKHRKNGILEGIKGKISCRSVCIPVALVPFKTFWWKKYFKNSMKIIKGYRAQCMTRRYSDTVSYLRTQFVLTQDKAELDTVILTNQNVKPIFTEDWIP